MTYLRAILGLLAASQLALGAFTLLAPAAFFTLMGLTVPPADTFYLIGMLASRFLVIGVAMALLAGRGRAEPLWLQAMLGIQIVDLAVGLYYTGTGVLPLSVSAFPMFNALALSLLLAIGLQRNGRALIVN